jgi:hypothetical protein
LMTAISFLPWTARESQTFLSLRTGYKVLRAAIAYISRSQGEDDEFKSVWWCHPSRLRMDQWRRMQWRRRWRRLSAYAPLMLGLAVIVMIVLLAVLLYLRVHLGRGDRFCARSR